jgi:glutamine amidotransferase
MIAIVDYGSGNIAAIANIYKQLKIPHVVSGEPGVLAAAERYILPGVGAFDTVMGDLARLNLVETLNEEVVGKGKKALGICVGMQILADGSDEGDQPGLGWIPGRIRRIDAGRIATQPKLPHMGWNSIRARGDAPMLRDVDLERGFYFLHNYYFDPDSEADVMATVAYGGDLTCAVRRGNVYGLQFHPEKSHGNGMAIFRNFAEL